MATEQPTLSTAASNSDRVTATEDLVAALLQAAIQVSEQPTVRKTTLAALMDAAEESGEDLGDMVEVIARANLTDALLGLRERGVIVLTDDGFAHAEDSPWPARWEKVSTWLQGLVVKKLDEWRMRSVKA